MWLPTWRIKLYIMLLNALSVGKNTQKGVIK